MVAKKLIDGDNMTEALMCSKLHDMRYVEDLYTAITGKDEKNEGKIFSYASRQERGRRTKAAEGYDG